MTGSIKQVVSNYPFVNFGEQEGCWFIPYTALEHADPSQDAAALMDELWPCDGGPVKMEWPVVTIHIIPGAPAAVTNVLRNGAYPVTLGPSGVILTCGVVLKPEGGEVAA